MTRYLLKRLGAGLFTLWLYLTVIFFLVQFILPGDFADQQALSYTESQRAVLRIMLELDDPIVVRYVKYMWNVLQGNLGYEYTIFGNGMPVIDRLKMALPPTLLVFGVGMALAIVLGYEVGKLTGWFQGFFVAKGLNLATLSLYTAFPPWMIFLITYAVTAVFKARIPYDTRNNMLWRSAELMPHQVMGLMVVRMGIVIVVLLGINELLFRWRRRRIPALIFVLLAAALTFVSWRLEAWYPFAADITRMTFLPMVAYTLISFGEVAFIMRTNMIDTLHEEYITTAWAKGLKPRHVRSRHAARNALVPSLSRMVISLPYLLTGMVMIELSLKWPALGTLLFNAMTGQNIPLWFGCILAFGFVSILARFFLDFVVVVLDPRVRYYSVA